MTGYNPDQQPKCRLTESAFRDDRLKPFFSNLLGGAATGCLEEDIDRINQASCRRARILRYFDC